MDPRELSCDTLAACAHIPEQVADLVIALAAREADLAAQMKELTRQLQQNSKHSRKPPSSDGYERPTPKSRGTKRGKMSGAQPGHDGARLALHNDLDHVLVQSGEMPSGLTKQGECHLFPTNGIPKTFCTVRISHDPRNMSPPHCDTP